MSKRASEYLEFRLQRSREDLRAAELSWQGGLKASAANRLYYSAFHAVTALLNAEGFVSKTHHGLRVAFQLRYIKTKRLLPFWGEFFDELMELRMDADYGDQNLLDAEVLSRSIPRLAQFIDEIEILLREGGHLKDK